METSRHLGARRVYEVTPAGDTAVSLRLKDRNVELGNKDFDRYKKVADWLPTRRPVAELESALGLKATQIEKFLGMLEEAGLVYSFGDIPKTLTGAEFHRDYFAKALPSWLSEGFSHPFWERMTSGKGSARLYAGWMFEIFHYTKNANRHMPLACAHGDSKVIKGLLAKHYAEEWNHYHYFSKALKAMSFTGEQVTTPVPLPMTMALSNFMRQAARKDTLAYAICSAVLEGTTTDRGEFNPYYEKCVELYGVPKAAVKPIYDHLDLDVKYQHSDLFQDIMNTVDVLSAERASLILSYGHQLVEHIWMWTENIEKYYDIESNPMPRVPFDPILD